MGDHEREPRSQGNPKPAARRHAHACAGEVDAVGLPQAIDALHLIGVERGDDLTSRPALSWLHVVGRLQAESRVAEMHREPSEPVVLERPFAVDPASDGLGDALVQGGQIDARSGVEVIEALGDRPAVAARGAR